MDIARFDVTTFLRCNTSSKLHSPAAFDHFLLYQQLAFVKQSVAGRTFLFLLLTLSLVLLTSACVKRGGTQNFVTLKANDSQSTGSLQPTPARLNINTASANELETLPGIGKSLAEQIIEHREKFGPFRRPEHLIIVRGISDKRFRALRDLITVE